MKTGIYYREFRKTDLLAVDPVEPVQIGMEMTDEMQQLVEDTGLSVTGVRGGVPVICGGVHPITEEQGEIWLRVGKSCLNYPVTTLRSIKEAFAIISECYPFKQFSTTIACGFEAGRKLAEFIGFHLVETKTYDNKKWLIFAKRVKE